MTFMDHFSALLSFVDVGDDEHLGNTRERISANLVEVTVTGQTTLSARSPEVSDINEDVVVVNVSVTNIQELECRVRRLEGLRTLSGGIIPTQVTAVGCLGLMSIRN